MNNLPWLANLLKSRNTIDSKGRGFDGRFRQGPLVGCSVDVQWHPKHDGQLSIKVDAFPDYYLVLAGPEIEAPNIASPWLIEKVFLFNASELMMALHERGVQIGSGTSVTGPLWERAEIYPVPRNNRLIISNEARKMLFLFGKEM